MKRQALYACVTCIPLSDDGLKPGGICLACSYYCHEGHELVELYTKRWDVIYGLFSNANTIF